MIHRISLPSEKKMFKPKVNTVMKFYVYLAIRFILYGTSTLQKGYLIFWWEKYEYKFHNKIIKMCPSFIK